MVDVQSIHQIRTKSANSVNLSAHHETHKRHDSPPNVYDDCTGIPHQLHCKCPKGWYFLAHWRAAVVLRETVTCCDRDWIKQKPESAGCQTMCKQRRACYPATRPGRPRLRCCHQAPCKIIRVLQRLPCDPFRRVAWSNLPWSSQPWDLRNPLPLRIPFRSLPLFIRDSVRVVIAIPCFCGLCLAILLRI